jgi:enterochelin esterase-like enzyme
MNFINIPKETPHGVSHKTFFSRLLNHEVGYNIYLPPNYDDTDEKYPVMYWLHGSGGNESSDIWVIERVKKYYESNINAAQMIIVFVNGFETSYYLDAPDGSLPVESIIITELLPHIDSTYRTITARTSRVIEGFSMGGHGALLYAAKYPELFCSVISYAGAFVGGYVRSDDGSYLAWEDISNLFPEWVEQVYRQNPAFVEQAMPYFWINKNAEIIRRDVKIRLVCGALDFLLNSNKLMHSHLDKLEIPHEYEIVEEIDHGNIGKMYDGIIGERGLCFHGNNIS